MILALLTYNHPHRKTQDIAFRLKAKGFDDVTFVILPWRDRKNWHPIYIHRPECDLDIMPAALSSRLNYEHKFVDNSDLADYLHENKFEKVLIGGAGIIQPRAAEENFIINAHPGFLPDARGLDAMKWSILLGLPVGVTVYRINKDVDSGQLIERDIIPIYYEDTFHAVTQRLYETEIRMMVDSITQDIRAELLFPDFPVYARMPHHNEIKMMDMFDVLRRNSKSKYN